MSKYLDPCLQYEGTQKSIYVFSNEKSIDVVIFFEGKDKEQIMESFPFPNNRDIYRILGSSTVSVDEYGCTKIVTCAPLLLYKNKQTITIN